MSFLRHDRLRSFPRFNNRKLNSLLFFAFAMALTAAGTALGLSYQSDHQRISRARSYERYLGEIFHTLRAERKVHLIQLELKGSMAALQRQLANYELRKDVRISDQTEISVMAVSRNARTFLDKM